MASAKLKAQFNPRLVSNYKELPGQTYRSPNCMTFYWREDDHDEFSVIPRPCQCSNHPINLKLNDVWYSVENNLVPELEWITHEEKVPDGIYQVKDTCKVMARPEPDQDYVAVKFGLYQGISEDGCLLLGSGVPSREVVAKVDGKLYRIPLSLIPERQEH